MHFQRQKIKLQIRVRHVFSFFCKQYFSKTSLFEAESNDSDFWGAKACLHLLLCSWQVTCLFFLERPVSSLLPSDLVTVIRLVLILKYSSRDTFTTETEIERRKRVKRRKEALAEKRGDGGGNAGGPEREGSGVFLVELPSIAVLS